jgi:uncharacterized protein YndB with AHSA1/START domain
MASDSNAAAGAQRPFIVKREFSAPRSLVFKAWTEPERLHKWFGPRGLTYVRGTCQLTPGGVAHSCLRTPDGQEMWGKWIFCDIAEPERLIFVNCFSDAAGAILRHPMNPNWPLQMLTTVTFREAAAGRTDLHLHWTPYDASPAEYEAFAAGFAGMDRGWGGTFAQLDAYLAGLAA